MVYKALIITTTTTVYVQHYSNRCNYCKTYRIAEKRFYADTSAATKIRTMKISTKRLAGTT